MSCCSQRREALSTTVPLRAAVAASRTPWPTTAPASVGAATGAASASAAGTQPLRYLGHAPLNVRGPYSARVYRVDVPGCVIAFDARDVAALLRTSLFERAD